VLHLSGVAGPGGPKKVEPMRTFACTRRWRYQADKAYWALWGMKKARSDISILFLFYIFQIHFLEISSQ